MQAFDLKCTIPEITEVGEPLLIYLDVSADASGARHVSRAEGADLGERPDCRRNHDHKPPPQRPCASSSNSSPLVPPSPCSASFHSIDPPNRIMFIRSLTGRRRRPPNSARSRVSLSDLSPFKHSHPVIVFTLTCNLRIHFLVQPRSESASIRMLGGFCAAFAAELDWTEVSST